MVCVMNFVEVGHDCLECDDSWFVPVVLRTGFSRTVNGGWSAILRRLLLRLLTGAESIRHSGLLIHCVVHGQPRVVQIKAELHIMLTDGEGLQYALEWNGPNALRPTFNLANVCACMAQGTLIYRYRIGCNSDSVAQATRQLNEQSEQMSALDAR